MSYTALGAPSMAQMKVALPACYSAEFDYCWDDANEHAPGCEKYAPVYALYHQPGGEAIEELVEQMTYCKPYCGPSSVAAVMAPSKPTGPTIPPGGTTYFGMTPRQIAITAIAFTAGTALGLFVRR